MRGSLVRLILTATLGATLSTACSNDDGAGDGPSPEPRGGPATISGTVTTRDGAELQEDALLIVTLWNATTGETTPVARIELPTDGLQPPLVFELEYETSAIDSTQEYVLAGEIHAAGRALYRTNSSVPVITQGNPADDIEIVVDRAP